MSHVSTTNIYIYYTYIYILYIYIYNCLPRDPSWVTSSLDKPHQKPPRHTSKPLGAGDVLPGSTVGEDLFRMSEQTIDLITSFKKEES